MPNRIIKESICDSESIDKLSWFEEVLFYRLIVNCDDYGRFDGRTAVIKNRLFPLKDNLTIKQVDAAVNNLATYGLLTVYKYDGKRFVALQGWDQHQQIRAKRSKYPAPEDGEQTDDRVCNQMISNDSKCPRNPIQSESESESESKKDAQARADVSADPLESAIREFIAYRKEIRKPMTDRAVERFRTRLGKIAATDEQRIAVIEKAIDKGWQDIYPVDQNAGRLNPKKGVYIDASHGAEYEDIFDENGVMK